MPDESRASTLEEQRELMELLSQETRHAVIQFILGHPAHLASIDELDHMVTDKTKKTVSDAVTALVEAGILDEYRYEANRDEHGLPYIFVGPTEYGVDILASFGYLNGLPLVRAVYEQTRKTEQIERHEDAPRPSLPDAVEGKLREPFEDPDDDHDEMGLTALEELGRGELGDGLDPVTVEDEGADPDEIVPDGDVRPAEEQ
jgi:DNA-binding transcriptional ArsR family regulator